MRDINKFVVVNGFGNNPDEIIEKSIEIGFEYPMPHFFLLEGKDGKVQAFKMRPVGRRCAVMRDEKVAQTGIGFVVAGNKKHVSIAISDKIGMIIKSIVDDLAIEDYTIISDEMHDDHMVYISDISPNKFGCIFEKIR